MTQQFNKHCSAMVRACIDLDAFDAFAGRLGPMMQSLRQRRLACKSASNASPGRTAGVQSPLQSQRPRLYAPAAATVQLRSLHGLCGLLLRFIHNLLLYADENLSQLRKHLAIHSKVATRFIVPYATIVAEAFGQQHPVADSTSTAAAIWPQSGRP